METSQAKKIELSDEEKKKQVAEAIKYAKKINPIEEKSEQDKKELEKTNKVRLSDFLQKQKTYRSNVFKMAMIKAQLEEYEKHIKAKHEDDKYHIPLKWEGMEYPIKILETTYNYTLLGYQNNFLAVNNSKEALTKYGITEEQLVDILEGKYIKEIPDGYKG